MKYNTKKLKQYLPIIIATVLFIILIAIVDFTLSRFSNKPSTNPTSGAYPSLSPTYLQNLPTQYKDKPIPRNLYEQGFGMYKDQGSQKVREYVNNRIQRYFIYKDVIESNKIDYRFTEEFTFAGMEREIPKMEQALRKQLIGSLDFAYIKVKYKNIVASQEATDRYGDLKDKATELIAKYRSMLSEPGADPKDVVAQSNADQVMLVLNDNQMNEYKTNYMAEQRLFYTDTDFQSFLYRQPEGVVSASYELKDANRQPYAIIIVLVTKKHGGTYATLNELINSNQIYFD